MQESEEAFITDLYRLHYQAMARTAERVIGTKDAAEDIVSDAFVRLIQKIDLLKSLSPNQQRAFCLTAAKYCALRYQKKKNRWLHIPYPDNLEDKETPETELFHKENRSELTRAFLSLPEQDRDLLFFRYILEISTGELCQTMNIQPNHLYQLLFRAREKIRAAWRKGGGENEE